MKLGLKAVHQIFLSYFCVQHHSSAALQYKPVVSNGQNPPILSTNPILDHALPGFTATCNVRTEELLLPGKRSL